VLFAATFGLTCFGLTRLARSCWPEWGEAAGVTALVLVLVTKAGNIGTNHLFEATLLDRLVGFALGWTALAFAVERPTRGWWASPLVLGMAILVHPGVGLQLGLLLGASWVIWALLPARTDVDLKRAAIALGALGVALAPGLFMNVGNQDRLFAGLPSDEFRLLSLEVQGPQHMLPHLWRFPQWMAWSCFPVLALWSFYRSRSEDRLWTQESFGKTSGEFETGSACAINEDYRTRQAARLRLAIVLGVNLMGLGLAWFGVEVLQDLRVTLFQPFRMATIFRGLVLVALSGRLLALWQSGLFLDRCRATFLAVGLVGDRAFVVAALFDGLLEILTRVGTRPRARLVAGFAFLGLGLVFLARHDTESGHVPLLAALGLLALISLLAKRWTLAAKRRRIAFAMVAAWVVPLAAMIAGASQDPTSDWRQSLLSRCRFSEAPTDDMERLALWCREHTPPAASFVGPPGPKTFRLWSQRNLAFNRAASPYHAAGLADWSARFRDHVGFEGPTTDFVHAYQADRHGLERRYQEMTDSERARLALREGASYVISVAPPPGRETVRGGPLQLLHVEGRYAVYQVRDLDSVANRDMNHSLDAK